MPTALSAAKRIVLDYYDAFDDGKDPTEFLSTGYSWRGVHPFDEIDSADQVFEVVWRPVRAAFSSLQRRPDVFFAGHNNLDGEAGTWVCQMGHLLGLFDRPWLGITPTRKMTFIRYAEFHRVDGDRIAESAFFTDIPAVMAQAGQSPFADQTGAAFVHPGPRTHDGVLLVDQDPDEGRRTMGLVDAMIDDLLNANRIGNETGDNRPPPESLEAFWHDDMIWYGPAGIGASYTIPRYQEQHQYPFREGLEDKVFNGHVTRFAEGSYAGFFGWPNLTNRPAGFLGVPESDQAADMRVVDIYRREGDKLAENWVFIDLLHWLDMLGHDVLGQLENGS